MKAVRLWALGVVVLVGCAATLPVKPTCKYQERLITFAEVEHEGSTYYIFGEEGMANMYHNFFDIQQCYSDLDIWVIQVMEMEN